MGPYLQKQGINFSWLAITVSQVESSQYIELRMKLQQTAATVVLLPCVRIVMAA